MKRDLLIRLVRLEKSCAPSEADEEKERQLEQERLDRLLGSFRRPPVSFRPAPPMKEEPELSLDEMIVVEAFRRWYSATFPLEPVKTYPKLTRKLSPKEKEVRAQQDEKERLDRLFYYDPVVLPDPRLPDFYDAAVREFRTLWPAIVPDRPFTEAECKTYRSEIAMIKARVARQIQRPETVFGKRRYFWNKKTARVRIKGFKTPQFSQKAAGASSDHRGAAKSHLKGAEER